MLLANKKWSFLSGQGFQRIEKIYPNFLMPNQEEKVQPNKEETKEQTVESLLNYECEDDDDGTDWET